MSSFFRLFDLVFKPEQCQMERPKYNSQPNNILRRDNRIKMQKKSLNISSINGDNKT